MSFLLEAKFSPFLDFEDVLSGVALEGAEIIETKIGELMREPKTGKPYRHQDGTVRPASAAGEAPGIDSKDFVGSFEAIALSTVEAQLYSEIGDSDSINGYGGVLEDYKNRPFTEPAIERAMPEIIDLIEKRIESEWR